MVYDYTAATTINAPASCELRSVICFLQAKGSNAAEIHCPRIVVNGEQCMSVSDVRKWCLKFSEGQTDFHDEGG